MSIDTITAITPELVEVSFKPNWFERVLLGKKPINRIYKRLGSYHYYPDTPYYVDEEGKSLRVFSKITQRLTEWERKQEYFK